MPFRTEERRRGEEKSSWVTQVHFNDGPGLVEPRDLHVDETCVPSLLGATDLGKA